MLGALEAQAWMPVMHALSLSVAKLLPVSPMTTGNLHPLCVRPAAWARGVAASADMPAVQQLRYKVKTVSQQQQQAGVLACGPCSRQC